ncbi:hypothetical protein FVEG_16024 [Fusarium verticillioides 7600]|uniref:Uncharacterized protein n=1 Tax=Gibberella moniliformis (strain M3125 / FGSC 7600) TaxID=334819 RepID=W7M5H8_GIBM7|nr:hypothetical protein FVEG_16024 [Fusarium verticillioides 7600]EWG46813.1 hypothetical protein FVEG_16024 [Fusarium verticillioides 7600]
MTQQQASLKMGRPILSRCASAKQPKTVRSWKRNRKNHEIIQTKRYKAGKLRWLHHYQKLTSSLWSYASAGWLTKYSIITVPTTPTSGPVGPPFSNFCVCTLRRMLWPFRPSTVFDFNQRDSGVAS